MLFAASVALATAVDCTPLTFTHLDCCIPRLPIIDAVVGFLVRCLRHLLRLRNMMRLVNALQLVRQLGVIARNIVFITVRTLISTAGTYIAL